MNILFPCFLLPICLGPLPSQEVNAAPGWFAPEHVQPGSKAHTIFIAGARAGIVIEWDLTTQSDVRAFQLDGKVTGSTVATHADALILSLHGAGDEIHLYDLRTGQLRHSASARAGARHPLLSHEGNHLYVCNQFDGTLSIYTVPALQEVRTLALGREPFAAALAGESMLAVAHLLPHGRADLPETAAAISLLDLELGSVVARIDLPAGSTAVRGLAVSPSGHWCAAVHVLGRFHVPAVQLAHGWMNVSALSLIDITKRKLAATVLLDEPRAGAANPWAVAWTPDQTKLVVAHAGTHELSIIDVAGLWEAIASQPSEVRLANLDLLKHHRQRVPLPGNGPRSLLLRHNTALVPEFFSDTLAVVSLVPPHQVRQFQLFPPTTPAPEREGERLFHDATLSFQHWQSCASCHPDARADALNWDLLNDGIGNPKNTKSLLLSHQTPPAMSLGRRETAQAAVRAGLRHIHFALRPEQDAQALDAYLSALQPVPSPFLSNPAFRQSAARGQKLFERADVGCAQCHPAPLYTTLKPYPVGTLKNRKGDEQALDTPTLVETWRTAPYLHDGSAATIREVLTSKNPRDQHGRTSHLTDQELEDLCAFVKSL